jgi:hypothetical protein
MNSYYEFFFELNELFHNSDSNYKNVRLYEIGLEITSLYGKEGLLYILDLLLQEIPIYNYSNDFMSYISNIEIMWDKDFNIFDQ